MAATRIVIISADEGMADHLAAALRPESYEVVIGSELSGVDLVDEEQPDLVIVDLSSLAARGQFLITDLHRIRSLAAVPILALSPRPRPLDMGVSATVLVPVEGDELRSAVRTLLLRRLAPAALPRPAMPVGRHVAVRATPEHAAQMT
jgi:DNA-binding response OmpR family regulator